MFVTADLQLGFIHIPKTGGTSVVNAVTAAGVEVTHNGRTHAYYKELDQITAIQWFATTRHPGARLHSAYYFQLEWDKKRYNKELALKSDLTEEFLKKRIVLFEEYGFENTITSDDFTKDYKRLKQQHNIKSLNAIEQLQSVCYYIIGCDNIKLFDITTESCELFDWLNRYNKNIKYTHNKKKSQNKPWQDEMSTVLLKYIKDNYKDDLERFNYKL
jgi:hypothetical protein